MAKVETISMAPEKASGRPTLLRISRGELARVLDFVEQFEFETDRALDLRTGNREMRMILHLVRSHLSGRLVTPSSLIAESGLSYGTGVRSVESLIERGLVMRRSRTKSGKTYSLHPSQKLMSQCEEYARRVKVLLGSAFGREATGAAADYYFGASYMYSRLIGPPPIMKEGLNLSGPLRLLIHADPTFLAMDALKHQFETIFGATIRTRSLSIDRLREEVLRNGERARSSYDLVACDLPWFAELAEKGVIAPLDEALEESEPIDFADFHPMALQSCTRRGVLHGVPIQTTPELLMFRSDLLEEAGVDPPETTDALLAAARQLHRPRKGMSGIAWNAAKGTPLGHSFLMMMAAFGRPPINLEKRDGEFRVEHIDGEQLRPQFDTPEALMTAEYMLELLSVSPASILNMSWYERGKAFASGNVAMAYCYSLLAPLFERDPDAVAHGRVGVMPHPHGPGAAPIAPLGGYALAIPANLAPERRNAAGRALALLTSASAAKLYVTHGSSVTPRFSLCGDPEVAAASPMVCWVDRIAREGLMEIWPRPPIPEICDVVRIVGEIAHEMLCASITAREALSRIQNEVDALMRARGRY